MPTITSDLSVWLPFGTTDSSVITACDFLSLQSITDAGGILNSGSPTFDSEGMSPGIDCDVRFQPSAALADRCYFGWQISCKVNRDWLCEFNTVTGSTGIDVPAIETLIKCWTGETILQKSTNENLAASYGTANFDKDFKDWRLNSAVSRTPFLNTNSLPDMVQVNIGVVGSAAVGEASGVNAGIFILAIDGITYAARQLTETNATSSFRRVSIGSNQSAGQDALNAKISHYQLCSQPPRIPPMHPLLSSIAVLSDSLFRESDTSSLEARTPNFRQNFPARTLAGYFEQQGFRVGQIDVDYNSGYTLRTTGSADLFDATNMSALEAMKAPTVMIRGGTNDGLDANAIPVDAAWDIELKSNIATILGWSSTERIIIGTVPSFIGQTSNYTSTARAKVAQMNDYINALPDFDARIFIEDSYNRLGAEAPKPNTFIGNISGGASEGNELHLAGVGAYLLGRGYGETLLNSL